MSFERLLDYVEDKLSPDEAGEVAGHVAGCPDCAHEVAWLRRVLDLMAAPELVSAPPEVVRRAQAMFQARPRRLPLRLPPLPAWLTNVRWPKAGAVGLRYLAAVAAVALVLLGGTWWAWGNTSVAQAATLTEVRGPVEVRLSEGADWEPAVPGMVLAAGSALRSGEGAMAVLAYPDGSLTQLAENAQLEILTLQQRRNHQAMTVRLSQTTGVTQHEVASAKSSVRVEARGAAAQARAGGYEVRVTDDAVEVRAAHGSVDVQAGGQTTHLARGQRGRVKGGHVEITEPEDDREDEGEGHRGSAPPGKSGQSDNPGHSESTARGGQASPPPFAADGGGRPDSASNPGQAKQSAPGAGQGPGDSNAVQAPGNEPGAQAQGGQGKAQQREPAEGKANVLGPVRRSFGWRSQRLKPATWPRGR
ncbi:MAG: zf-HC2 domain-containing protein [Anaerolineae bacterium]|nr:zf-HC2 domain-containing protein [Anaerolineae bacterium]